MNRMDELLAKAEAFSQELPAAPPSLLLPQGKQIASWIDHTQLKPEAIADSIKKLCSEAREHGFATICVNSANIPLAARLLEGSGVLACSTVGFPLGAMLTSAKVYETNVSLEEGAEEIDMVLNVGALKGGSYDLVLADIQGVVEATHRQKRIIKVILETALLTRKEKIIACLISKQAGADFVKTSTGFVSGGATVEDIDLMFRVVGNELRVKASGGIRDLKTAHAMIRAGASRLGVSAGVQILEESIMEAGIH